MSKLQEGKSYMTRSGVAVTVLSATTTETASAEGGSEYTAEIRDTSRTGTIRYKEDGTALGATNDDLEIVDMLDDSFAAGLPPLPQRPAATPAPVTDPPHRDLIQAVLDGKTVQWQRPGNTDQWDDFMNKGFAIQMLVGYCGVKDVKFRLKPEDTDAAATKN